MVRHGRVLANKDSGLICRGTLPVVGFGEWWSPQDVTFGEITLGGDRLVIILSPLWDGAPDGRTGLITSQTPPRDRERVRDFFRG